MIRKERRIKMSIDIKDYSGKPRSDQDLIEAQTAIKNNLILSKPTPIMVHYPTIIEAINELLLLRKRSKMYKHYLNNLLAVIHRDGGHYTQEHGIEKSAKDAEKKIYWWEIFQK